jgi:hypothetical protein
MKLEAARLRNNWKGHSQTAEIDLMQVKSSFLNTLPFEGVKPPSARLEAFECGWRLSIERHA